MFNCEESYVSLSARRHAFLSNGHLGQRTRVLLNPAGHNPAIYKLATPLTFDEAGFLQDLQMVRHGGGRDCSHGHDLATSHVRFSGDRLKDHEAGFIGQGL